MQQGIPVVVPQEAAYAELVTPGVTGFRVPGDSSVTVVAEVARVLSDASAQRAMGEAAALRAAREYAWDSFVDMAATLLAQAGGVAGARVTSRPSLTPA
jgi:glycosyltransferase involved in cell wall biosynthesis